jgi:hypothetical protein
MAQIPPWYSIRQADANVYHDDDRCPEGNAIDVKYRKPGRRCRARCRTCAKLGALLLDPKRLAELTPL